MSLFENYLSKIGEVGHVHSVNSGIVYCTGLAGARINEKVVFENEQIGFVYSIGREFTELLLLDSRGVDLGTVAVRTGETMTVSVSEEMLGSVVDPFGNPLERIKVSGSEERSLEAKAPPLIDRVRINQNLETGVTLVDLLLPIGRGQRQLILGDQKTGKTSFLVQTMARQVQLGNVCVYACLGKKKSDLASIIDKLTRLGVMGSVVVVAAPASVPTSLIYLAPFSAMSIAEYFRDKGNDVLVILDEISAHARYYRELAITSRKMPGRDGYPGDIFYLHSHLMERAGRFLIGESIREKETLTLKIEGKTASITCLPVVETKGGDLAGYIQTNLMSMTDGHLFFDVNQFQEGQRPAVNIGLSVTRIGKQTQKTVERDVALKLRKILFDYSKARDVAKFGVELLQETQQRVVMGEKVLAVFDQLGETIVPRTIQLLFVELLINGFWESADIVQIKQDKETILNLLEDRRIVKISKQLKEAIEIGSAKKFTETVISAMADLEQICLQKSS